jgi:hypothetical protein
MLYFVERGGRARKRVFCERSRDTPRCRFACAFAHTWTRPLSPAPHAYPLEPSKVPVPARPSIPFHFVIATSFHRMYTLSSRRLSQTSAGSRNQSHLPQRLQDYLRVHCGARNVLPSSSRGRQHPISTTLTPTQHSSLLNRWCVPLPCISFHETTTHNHTHTHCSLLIVSRSPANRWATLIDEAASARAATMRAAFPPAADCRFQSDRRTVRTRQGQRAHPARHLRRSPQHRPAWAGSGGIAAWCGYAPADATAGSERHR